MEEILQNRETNEFVSFELWLQFNFVVHSTTNIFFVKFFFNCLATTKIIKV